MAVNTNKLLNTIDERYSSIEVIDWHGIEIKCKKYLTLEEEEIFANTCIKACFNDNGEYTPNHCEFVIKYMTIKSYTDIDINDDVDIANRIINTVDLYEKITSVINNIQYNDIVSSIWKKVEHIKKINESEIYIKLNKIIDSINDIANSIEESFNGIDSEYINKFISSFSNGEITQEGIANAVLKSIK